MKDNKKDIRWMNKRILHPNDADQLDTDSAVNEFEHGLPREEAEARAYSDYTKHHHSAAAASHLRGLRSAEAAGDLDEARKHHIAYSLHMSKLGYDPLEQVPDEIKNLTEADDKKTHYKFKAAPGDALLLDE